MHENENEGGDENNDENDNENENENENENDNEESGDMTNGYRIGGDIISDSINSSNVLMGAGDYNKCQSLTRIQYNNNTTDYQTNNGGIGNGNGNGIDNVINVNEFRVLDSDNMRHSVVQALQREGEEETKKEERKDHVTDQMQQEREIFGQNDIVYDVLGNATSTSTATSSASVSAIDNRGGVHFNSLTGMHVYHIF